jgi:FkbM family methyltransferase
LKQKRFAAEATKSSVVYDVGANVGFYTLLASACVGRKGKVLAFEPFDENLMYLERHLRMNQCGNVQVFDLAVSDRSGKLRFERGTSRETGRLSDEGDLEVSAVSLDDVAYEVNNPRPDLIKLDVEGAELQVLDGAKRLLREHPPLIFLATHSSQLHSACCSLLRSFDYRLEAIDGSQVMATDELICHPPRR